MKAKSGAGFTLIELLVVISIIRLFASVVMVALNGVRIKARDAKRIATLKQLATALNLYYSDNSSYPTCDTLGYPNACLWSTWPGWLNLLSSQYVSKVPVDPLNTDLGGCNAVANCHIYHYCSYNGGQNFVLAVNLENAQAQPMAVNANCAEGGPNHYWVGN